jgi:hypothetical protein
MTGRRRWWWRVAGGVIGFAGIETTVLLINGTADELRLALVVALVVCASAVLIDASPVEPAVWAGHTEPEAGLARLDPRTAAYLRILESHLTARGADGALRHRLRDLADQTLHARHDLGIDDPRAEELLGHELHRVLHEGPTRLDPDRIERCVKRIEEL